MANNSIAPQNEVVDSATVNIDVTNVNDYPLSIEAFYLQILTCKNPDALLSTDNNITINKRIDLGTVRFTDKSSAVQVNDNDSIYDLNNYATGFFKLKYDYSEIINAINCAKDLGNKRSTSSRDMGKDLDKLGQDKKIGDVWLFIVCKNPSTGEAVTIRRKVNKR